MIDESALARALLAARADGLSVTLPIGLDLPAAWRVAALTQAALQADGAVPRGWKIGFTNRSIWPRYGVHQPIWGRVWDRTLQMLDGAEATLSLAGLVAPRIEPEIVLGFGRAPEPGMDEAALASCLDWVAHGLEIVHTHVGWQFDGPAAPVADFGLHGRLFVGPRVTPAALGGPVDLPHVLAALQLDLSCGHEWRDRGRGANVLEGPLSAVRLWLQAMADQTPGMAVAAGELVTTGTLTDAHALAAGESWTTRIEPGILSGLGLRCVA